MSISSISTPYAPRPIGTYSQAIVVNGFLYTAGVGPTDPVTGDVPDGIVAQTRRVMTSLQAILSESGLGFADVVKATVHLQDLHRDFADFTRCYAEFVSEPYPVRTTVGSNLLDILVEVDLVAVLRA